MIGEKNIIGLEHIGIPCSDIESTVAFYNSLGFQTVMRTRNEATDEKVAFLRLGNVTIETYEVSQISGRPGSINHIALSVKDVDNLYAEVKRSGYALIGEEIESLPFWENGVKFFKIVGPNSEIIEFSQIL